MPSHVTFVVRVGAGAVLGGVGTLASPWPGGCLVCMRRFGHTGRRKRPHPSPHHSHPYGDSERDMAGHVAVQKPTAVSDPRGRHENLTVTENEPESPVS